MKASPRPKIQPDWTLSQLKEKFPGVELTLFAHFGVGSRERSGFSGTERLDDLLRRHLVFDAQEACARLDKLAQEDWDGQWTAIELKREYGSVAVVDARGRGDFERCHLPQSHYLSAETVAKLKSNPKQVVVVCNDGSQSPAAARVLRTQGVSAGHLRDGLVSWSRDVDPNLPILFPLKEVPGCWHLLSDEKTLRFRRMEPLDSEVWTIWSREQIVQTKNLEEFVSKYPQVERVAVSPRTFSVSGTTSNLCQVAEGMKSWVGRPVWLSGGTPGDEAEERRLLERVLTEVAPEILSEHKGTVEISRYQNRVLELVLGGGCEGCVSTQITTQRELGGALFAHVPLLDSIVNG